jgi:hypothetical protein
MRHFGASRIDWALLDATETLPITYEDGDFVVLAGQTLQMKNGELLPVDTGNDASQKEFSEFFRKTSTALVALANDVTLEQASSMVQAAKAIGESLREHNWLKACVLDSKTESEWFAAMTATALSEVLDAHSTEPSFKYFDRYAELSEALKSSATTAKKLIKTAKNTDLKGNLKMAAIHYSKKDGYSSVWMGVTKVKTIEESVLTQSILIAKARYDAKSPYLTKEVWQSIHGKDFDPMLSDDYCLGADGKFCQAADYYSGEYENFLAEIDAQIEACKDPVVLAKLIRQKENAEPRLLKPNPDSLSFSMRSHLVTDQEIVEYLVQNVSPFFVLANNKETGEPEIIFDKARTDKEGEEIRNLRRFAAYVKSGTVSTETKKDHAIKDPTLAANRMEALRRMIVTHESGFNAWAKNRSDIMNRVNEFANDPKNITFKHQQSFEPMTIDGLNEEYVLHGYQADEVQRQSRNFGGINAFDVGLGKTFTALAAVQYAHNIGAKKKTLFVLPNSVVSNWRKEAGKIYKNMDDCLFVGGSIDKNGKFKVKSSDYDKDLTTILTNQHSKIFMSFQAFQRLRLKPETVNDYLDAMVSNGDNSLDENVTDKKTSEKSKDRKASLIESLIDSSTKSASAPYFEQLGVDSIVVDEAHAYKNSKAAKDFDSAKYLSVKSDPSARGLDAQVKAWFVRGGTPKGDGFMILTATPLTNSPQEIYSMMTLAIGEKAVSRQTFGSANASQFLEIFCVTNNQDDLNINGTLTGTNVFTGLRNVGALRGLLTESTNMKKADDVGDMVKLPSSQDVSVAIALPKEMADDLKELSNAYLAARGSSEPEHKAAFTKVSARTGESQALIGHPFNLISKMQRFIIDPELETHKAAVYQFTEDQLDLAAKVVSEFNKKGIKDKDKVSLRRPHTKPSSVVSRKVNVNDDGTSVDLLTILVQAEIEGTTIYVDSMDAEVHLAFDDLAEKMGLNTTVSVSPKMAALIENVSNELAQPRGIVGKKLSPVVKQIIFCDVLASFAKTKKLLVEKCGIPANKIVILTGEINGKVDEILDVQNGFNADGEDNKYQIVLANEKAEVGINLQVGVQAMHHLTTGWTPDSLTQRNGRGVRQGNEIESKIIIYHYDAKGTFDSYKRNVVAKKASWIDALASDNPTDFIEVNGGLTNAQMAAMIKAVGDDGAIARIEAESAKGAVQEREKAATLRQAQIMTTYQTQMAFVENFDLSDSNERRSDAVENIREKLVTEIKSTAGSISSAKRSLTSSTAGERAIEKAKQKLVIGEANLKRQLKDFFSSFKDNGNFLEKHDGLDGSIEYVMARFNAINTDKKALDDFLAGSLKIYGQPNRWSGEPDLIEDSAMFTRFKKEGEEAKSFADKLKAEFAQVAKENPSAFPAKAIHANEKNNFMLVNGVIFELNSFVLSDGIKKESKGLTSLGFVVGFNRPYIATDGYSLDVAFFDGNSIGITRRFPLSAIQSTITSRSSRWGEMVQDAAEIDNQLLSERDNPLDNKLNGMELFGRYCPAVADLHNVKILMPLDDHTKYEMPQGCYPSIMDFDRVDLRSAPTTKKYFENKQKEFVIRGYGSGKYEPQNIDIVFDVFESNDAQFQKNLHAAIGFLTMFEERLRFDDFFELVAGRHGGDEFKKVSDFMVEELAKFEDKLKGKSEIERYKIFKENIKYIEPSAWAGSSSSKFLKNRIDTI